LTGILRVKVYAVECLMTTIKYLDNIINGNILVSDNNIEDVLSQVTGKTVSFVPRQELQLAA
jgi:ABC-type cobalamin/Fe3+-siderophores transport system ATPase subunit